MISLEIVYREIHHQHHISDRWVNFYGFDSIDVNAHVSDDGGLWAIPVGSSTTYRWCVIGMITNIDIEFGSGDATHPTEKMIESIHYLNQLAEERRTICFTQQHNCRIDIGEWASGHSTADYLDDIMSIGVHEAKKMVEFIHG